MFCSDLHGSDYYGEKLMDAFIESRCQKLIILGDLYYHGPRNPLTLKYSPIDLCTLLNEHKDSLFVIKGNCDSEVDQTISEFKFHKETILEVCGHKVFCTHGHLHNKTFMPKGDYDILIYGHTHCGFIEEKEGITVANCGSVSLPKGGSVNSYIILTDSDISLYDLMTGQVIQTKQL